MAENLLIYCKLLVLFFVTDFFFFFLSCCMTRSTIHIKNTVHVILCPGPTALSGMHWSSPILFPHSSYFTSSCPTLAVALCFAALFPVYCTLTCFERNLRAC